MPSNERRFDEKNWHQTVDTGSGTRFHHQWKSGGRETNRRQHDYGKVFFNWIHFLFLDQRNDDQVNRTNNTLGCDGAHRTRTCTSVSFESHCSHFALVAYPAYCIWSLWHRPTVTRKYCSCAEADLSTATTTIEDWGFLSRVRLQCTDSIKTLIFTFVSRCF